MAFSSILLLLLPLLRVEGGTHGASYSYPLAVLSLDLTASLPSVTLPFVNQMDDAFILSVYLHLN